jgi:glucosyl-3-phosphoglycerate synthase
MNQINPLMKKMVVFDMDNTLLQGKFIDACAKKYNFKQALALLRNIDKNSISLNRRIGSFLEGKAIRELVGIVDEIPMPRDIHAVVDELKERGYLIGVLSDTYQQITAHVSKKIGADFYVSYELADVDGIATGTVNIPSYFYFNENSSCDHPVCKTNALRHICRQHNVEMENAIVIGDSDNDLCMIRHAGIGVAFCTTSEILRTVAPLNITRPAFTDILEYAP